MLWGRLRNGLNFQRELSAANKILFNIFIKGDDTVKKCTFLLVFMLGLFIASCGDKKSDEGGGDAVTNKEGTIDPWANVGMATLPESGAAVTDTMRALAFGDGMVISYDGSRPDEGESACRREQVEEIWYEVCMPLEDDPFMWSQLLMFCTHSFLIALPRI